MPEMDKLAGNGWKWMEMVGNGWLNVVVVVVVMVFVVLMVFAFKCQ